MQTRPLDRSYLKQPNAGGTPAVAVHACECCDIFYRSGRLSLAKHTHSRHMPLTPVNCYKRRTSRAHHCPRCSSVGLECMCAGAASTASQTTYLCSTSRSDRDVPQTMTDMRLCHANWQPYINGASILIELGSDIKLGSDTAPDALKDKSYCQRWAGPAP